MRGRGLIWARIVSSKPKDYSEASIPRLKVGMKVVSSLVAEAIGCDANVSRK